MSKRTYIFIGICFAFFAAIMLASFSEPSIDSVATIPDVEVEQPVVPDNASEQPNKIALMAACEIAVKPQLKNPKSFDIDVSQTQLYADPDKLVLAMFYYAENSFGATGTNTAFCEFSPSGMLINVMNTQ